MYGQILQLIALSMRSLGSSAMFYLAAAVSEFYVPWETMSRSGPLYMRLAEVPKMLSVLGKDWAPMAFCVSFKFPPSSNEFAGFENWGKGKQEGVRRRRELGGSREGKGFAARKSQLVM
ncbi:unnamed protein product [Fraxinus pennsylvanica]|uniref:Uncharacterized protein n=1 Tax=Fraxinus pennsylvanica TaxID=56036 RepID=A0AAD2DUL7_9LAMI|nr:unnamed protein product [Fraxinus pennsylvanica]